VGIDFTANNFLIVQKNFSQNKGGGGEGIFKKKRENFFPKELFPIIWETIRVLIYKRITINP
jgi:hypothetical protein